ncbi:MAG: FecR domain-containing protein [Sandaracinaceae bacterium]|nr:FecR domain-containing protein [Sandaracinaceae bacterium]
MRRGIVTLLALSALAPATAGAQVPQGAETFEYVVVEGESCPSIAQTVYGDRRRYDIVHAYNENLGPLPHRLRPGQRLVLPIVAVRADGPDAEVTAMQPNVRGRPSEQRDWRSLQLGTDLERGWRVNTLERAFAELTFRDETQVSLRENTVVVVFGASAADTRRSASEAQLDRGSLRARLAELRGRSVRVTTPSARADLEGGAAVVSVDDSDTSRVSNHEGRAARVSTPNGQGTVTVAPGMGSSVAQGARPTPPRPLPPAPRWVDAQPARWVGVAQRTTIRGEWAPVPVAGRYRVEITRGGSGAGLVAAVEVPPEVTRFEVHHLPPGHYFARVSTIGRDFFESRPSEAYAFEIALGRLRAPWEPADAQPSFDHGDPSEEVRPLEVLPGSLFEAPEGARCALDGEPASSFTLAAGEEGTVRCVDDAGAALGGIDLAVRAAEPRVPQAAEPTRVELIAGRPTEVAIQVRASSSLPPRLVARGSGVTVTSSTWDGETLTAELVAAEAGEGSIELVHAEDAATALATLAFVARPADVAAPEAPLPPRPPPHLLHEGLSASLLASSVGVRDLDRRGVSAVLALAYTGAVDATVGDRLRAALGVHGDVIDDHLRLGAAAAIDLYGSYARTSQRGSGDVWLSAAYLPRLEDVGLMFELGAFLPAQQGPAGIGAVRLAPTVELSLRVADERVALRTRQTALFDLADGGNAMWASAYAADVWIVGPWSAGAELGLTLGQEDSDLLFAPVAGVATWIDLGPVSLELAGRFGLGDDAASAVGPAAFLLSIRGGNQPWRPEVGW